MDTVTALAAALNLDALPLLDLRDLVVRTSDRTASEGKRSTLSGPHSPRLLRGPGPNPRLIGPIPPAALAFQHRDEADRLRAMLDGGGTAVLHGRPVGGMPFGGALVGMGGVGKSQLAADYARTTLAEGAVDLVVWVTATDRSAVIDRFAQAGRELCPTGGGNPEQAAHAFLAWLTPRASTAAPVRWLVVLDDLTQPTDLDGLWPPDSPDGRTLITTRRQDAALIGPGRIRLEVGVFTPEQATAHLADALVAYGRSDPCEELAMLAADLGYLPLAVSQAAAYLCDTGATVASYRQALADRVTALRELAPDVLPDQQPHTVAAAWVLSIDHADTLRPAGLARLLLQLAAHLGPNGIPHTALTSAPARTYLTDHRSPQPQRLSLPETVLPSAGTEPVSVADTERAISVLRRLSLITHTPETPSTAVRVHQLLQHAVRDTLPSSRRDEAARTAADALLTVWPSIERDTHLAQVLRANATALTAHARDALFRPEAHEVLFRAGNSLGEAGQVTAARDHFRHLITTTTAHLGDDHRDTLMARSRLARWQGAAGDAAGAAAASASLLTDRIRILGEDHPHTLATRGNLAHWRGTAGDAAGAAVAAADLLADRIRLLGEDHPDTLIARSNLARWRGEAGDAAGAAAAFTELVDDMLRVLGHDHPYTLAARGSLARWRGEAGDAAGAAAQAADLLADRIRVLGQTHPHTLATRGHLARWKGEAGDAAEAASAFTDLIDDIARVLGENHSYTLTARRNLALWREAAGKDRTQGTD
ncbi:tetratricopeptide repeat protein [Streptomyces sp. NPDC002755]